MTEQIRLAVVGCGAIAESMHIPAAASIDEAELSALVDTDGDRVRLLADRYGVSTTSSCVREIAEHVDAVVLATPPHVRPALAEEAFSLGLHVFCEKPLANTTAECEAIIDASRRANRVLAVGHMFRFWPSRIAVKELVEQKALGPVRYATVTQGKPYSWQAVSGYTVRREMVPGGVLINAGIHPLDTLLWWFGDPVDTEYEDDALGGLESNVRMTLRFPEEVVVHFRHSRTCKLPDELRVEAEQGTVLLPTYSLSSYSLSRKESTSVGARASCPAHQRLTRAGSAQGRMPALQQSFPLPSGAPEAHGGPLRDGLAEVRECGNGESDHNEIAREQLRDFVGSIVEGRAPRVTGEEATRVVRLIEECYRLKRERPLPRPAPIPGLTW